MNLQKITAILILLISMNLFASDPLEQGKYIPVGDSTSCAIDILKEGEATVITYTDSLGEKCKEQFGYLKNQVFGSFLDSWNCTDQFCEYRAQFKFNRCWVYYNGSCSRRIDTEVDELVVLRKISKSIISRTIESKTNFYRKLD